MIKPLLMLLLPDLLVIGGEVAVESVVVGQEVRGRGVRVVQQGIVHVFVVGADPLAQSHLLDPLSVLLPSSLLSGARLHIVVGVVELGWSVLLLLLSPVWIIVLLLLHSHRVLLLLHHL